jgi:ubiquinone biosynthesis protein UbiJ
MPRTVILFRPVLLETAMESKVWPPAARAIPQLVLVLALLLAACAPPASEPKPTTTPTMPLVRPNSLTSLLTSSWATNGSVGYFVDDYGNAGGAVSLYDTAWWQKIARMTGIQQDRLNPDAVSRWLLPIMRGEADEMSNADSTTNPRLAVLETTTDLALGLEIRIEAQNVASQIEQLRAGDLYKSRPTDATGDLGSTALAISILRKVGIHPPAAVMAKIETQLGAALSTRRPEDVFNLTIPVLTTLDAAQISQNHDKVAGQLAWIRDQLPAMNPITRLTAAASLKSLVASVSGETWPRELYCKNLLTSADGVLVAENTRVNARATFAALDLGCIAAVTPPPWTIHGWPNQQTISAALSASVAGARLAGVLSRLDQFKPFLQAAIERHWSRSSGSDPAQTASLAMLTKILELSWTAPDLSSQVTETVAGPLQPQSLVVLLAGWATATKPPIGTRKSSSEQLPTDRPTMIAATAAELKFRLTGDVQLHQYSLALLASLAVDDMYAAAVSPGQTAEPSVVATALAAWISGKPMPTQSLIEAGLCNVDLSCSAREVHEGSPLDSPLRASAAMVAMSKPDVVGFPLAV